METLDYEIYNSGNFVKTSQPTNVVLDNQAKFLVKYKLDTDKKIPFLYWTAKLHKNPYSQRFITSGRGCATQPLSIKVGHCLKTVLTILRSNSKFHRKKTGYNNCFVIDNRNPIISHIKHCNQTNNIHSVSTYDFKTLYTSIPHDKLKHSLATSIRTAFNSRKKKFINVSGERATLANEKKSSFSLTAQQLIECVNFIIDQSYISYKGEIYRQCIGVPMGTNCAPHVANLFLHTYEYKYINHLVATGRTALALLLANMFRYQDDCIVFNDQGSFGRLWNEIYPPEMQLEQTNVGNSYKWTWPFVLTTADLHINLTTNVRILILRSLTILISLATYPGDLHMESSLRNSSDSQMLTASLPNFNLIFKCSRKS